jgi:hypothetical protein
MSTFALVPGAGGGTWYWHRLRPELEARGHQALAVDLPGPDPSAGLPEYADAIVSEIGRLSAGDTVVVAQSMGAFSAVMACDRVPVSLLVLVNAMVPLPGETPGEWWGHAGSEEARVAAAKAGGYPVEFDVPTRLLAGRDDRFFPLLFQRRVAKERLGAEVGAVPVGTSTPSRNRPSWPTAFAGTPTKPASLPCTGHQPRVHGLSTSYVFLQKRASHPKSTIGFNEQGVVRGLRWRELALWDPLRDRERIARKVEIDGDAGDIARASLDSLGGCRFTSDADPPFVGGCGMARLRRNPRRSKCRLGPSSTGWS